MARRKAILQSEFPYLVTARCINREWFHLPMESVWEIMSEELFLTHLYFDLRIHAFVLMSNHFHLIASTPNANISKAMHYFMFRVSRRLTEAGNRINETFAGRHYKCILQTSRYFLNAYKYVYRNPVDAGLCGSAVEYPFSTLHGLLGLRKMIIPVDEDTTLFSDLETTLAWIDTEPSPTKLEAMKWGFRRTYFAPLRCRRTGKPILEKDDAL